MKQISFLLFGFLLYMLPVVIEAQCVIDASATPTTVCYGDSVYFSSVGHCDYLMSNDFNNQTLGVGWSSTAANPVFNNPCGPGPNGFHAWVGTTASPIRTLETINYDVSSGTCKIEWWMRYGRIQGQGPCEDPDLPNEGVHLQYSIDNGTTWTDFPGPDITPTGINATVPPFVTNTPGSGGYWTPLSGQTAQLNDSRYYWHQYSCDIPIAASTTNTKFRWAQLSNSSTGWDAWGIDEVEITCPTSNATVFWEDPNGNVIGDTKILGNFAPTITGWYSVTIVDFFPFDMAVDSVWITVNPITYGTENIEICEGQLPYSWHGNMYTSEGSFIDTIQNSLNCDSIVTLNLTVHQNTSHTLHDTVCDNNLPYVWNGLNYDAPGIYSKILVNSNGCDSIDILNLYIKPSPQVFIGVDTTICSTIPLTLDAGNPGASYLWNTGETTQSITVNAAGLYWVLVHENGCQNADSIKIFTDDPIEINLGNDTTCCIGKVLILTLPAINTPYLWQDGSIGNTYTVDSTGKYIVSSQNMCGLFSDEIFVKFIDCSPGVYLPNAFTPNDDGLNDVFKVVSKNLIEFEIWIFDRWGVMIYSGDQLNDGWDGTFDNALCPEGVYFWKLTYTNLDHETKTLYGSVLLLR